MRLDTIGRRWQGGLRHGTATFSDSQSSSCILDSVIMIECELHIHALVLLGGDVLMIPCVDASRKHQQMRRFSTSAIQKEAVMD